MNGEYRSEGDVEAKLIQPLFRDVLGYPDAEMRWKAPVPITIGRQRLTKQADLIVYRQGQPVVAVEAKRPTEPVTTGLDQVDSYAFALRTPYSVITNGRHLLLRGYFSFNSRMNVVDETVDDLIREQWNRLRGLISFRTIDPTVEPLNPVAEPSGQKIRDYRRFFRKIHNIIRDGDRLDPSGSFDELSKLLFLKAAEDEWQHAKPSKAVLTPEMIDSWGTHDGAIDFVNRWFKDATDNFFPGLFEDQRITLSINTLKQVLAEMKPFHVRDGDVDVKGRAFEEFLPSQLRGKGLGQYFTPRPVVDFMAGLAGISIQDVVVDFACGSGGFLIKAFEQMKDGVEQLPAGTIQRMGTTRAKLLDDIKANQIFGIDAEPRAARTAKMNMLMWGDGRRVVRGNALGETDFNGRPYEPAEYDEDDPGSGCTLILANPPFGSREKDATVLHRYALGSMYRERASEKTEVLFLEKGLKLLRPEGRMLIVLPQGLLSGSSNDRVRDFIHAEAEIRSIVTLPTHAFVQSGVPTVNTCILYLQKFTKEKKEIFDRKTAGLSAEAARSLLRADPDFDYMIFMGTAEFIGYEPSGRMIAAKDEDTDLDLLISDFNNQSILDVPRIDLFDFAATHYGEKSHRRRDQTIRGTTKGLKTAFTVRLSETEDRLDPPYYLFRQQAGPVIAALPNLGAAIQSAGTRFRPSTDDEMDAEYPVLSVSSDGKVSLNELRKGEDITQAYKRVRAGDIVYNPMRINIGSVGVVPDGLSGGLASPDYVVCRSTKLDPQFLVNLLRSPFYRLYIDLITTGSIRDRLYIDDLRSLRVPEVDRRAQADVCAAIERIEESVRGFSRTTAAAQSQAAEQLNGLVTGSTASPTEAGDAEAMFRVLVEEWRCERPRSSSAARMASHPAYVKIIDMGRRAVPLLLRELRERPDHWFAALHALTGENPVPEESRGRLPQMAAAWIAWGERNGYI